MAEYAKEKMASEGERQEKAEKRQGEKDGA